MAATVAKALELWKAGEKVLIFCHYLATGETVRQRVDQALDSEIHRMAAEKLRCSPDATTDELERRGQRFCTRPTDSKGDRQSRGGDPFPI